MCGSCRRSHRSWLEISRVVDGHRTLNLVLAFMSDWWFYSYNNSPLSTHGCQNSTPISVSLPAADPGSTVSSPSRLCPSALQESRGRWIRHAYIQRGSNYRWSLDIWEDSLDPRRCSQRILTESQRVPSLKCSWRDCSSARARAHRRSQRTSRRLFSTLNTHIIQSLYQVDLSSHQAWNWKPAKGRLDFIPARRSVSCRLLLQRSQPDSSGKAGIYDEL